MTEETTHSEDLQIDKHSLDTEWEKMPSTYMKWSEKYANAVLKKDKAKSQLDLTYSDIDQDVRTRGHIYGLEKLTEPSIKAAVTGSNAYQEAQDSYYTASYHVNVLAGGKTALEMKKAALDNLTKLHLAGYYQTKTDIPDTVSKKQREDGRERSSKRLKRKLSKIK